MSAKTGDIDMGALKARLVAIVTGNRKVFEELIAQHGYTPKLEAAAGVHPVLADLKAQFTREISTSLMGFTMSINPEPGLVVSGEVVKVRLTEGNGPQGAELHVITRAPDHVVNEFRIPLEVLDTGLVSVVAKVPALKLH